MQVTGNTTEHKLKHTAIYTRITLRVNMVKLIALHEWQQTIKIKQEVTQETATRLKLDTEGHKGQNERLQKIKHKQNTNGSKQELKQSIKAQNTKECENLGSRASFTVHIFLFFYCNRRQWGCFAFCLVGERVQVQWSRPSTRQINMTSVTLWDQSASCFIYSLIGT